MSAGQVVAALCLGILIGVIAALFVVWVVIAI
jgi:hypothetical protein